MKYSEAKQELYNRPWKTSTCGQGESCWCRIIKTIEPIEYQVNKSEEDKIRFDKISEVVPMGAIDADFAEYVVTLHNDYLEQKSKPFEAF
jgi:hypothetical protein